MKVYCFPGLGFNKRALEPLQSVIPSLEIFDWKEPIFNESLAQYASRLAKSLSMDHETVLIGHSLGGMLVQELAAQYSVRKVVLISSITGANENPWHFKMLGPLGLYYFFSRRLTTGTLKLWGPAHDYSTPQEQKVFSEMVHSYSRTYYRWALRELSRWKAPKLRSTLPVVRLHGTKDLTFPLKNMNRTDFEIKDGGHFMLYNKADVLGPILQKEIQS